MSLIEVLITIAIVALGLIVATRSIQAAIEAQSSETGQAIAALTPLSVDAPMGDAADRNSRTGGEPQRTGNDGDKHAAKSCSGFFSCVWEKATSSPTGALDLWWDYVFEIGRGAVNDVTGIWDMVTDPGSLVDAAKYVWDNPLDAARQLVWDDKSGEMWGQGNYTGAIGRTVWNVGSWFIPGVDVARAAGVLGKFGKLGKLAKLERAASKASKVDAPKTPKRPDAPPRRKPDENKPKSDTDCSDGVCRARQCFAAGTLVHAERGLIAIEQVQVGERVWSRDEALGTLALHPVVRTFVTPDRPVLQLEFVSAVRGEPQTLTVTADHPFWSTAGWTAAKDLQSGALVSLRSGAWARVTSRVSLDGRINVYNFEVAESHTYFVGESGVWVHNLCEQERLDNFRRQVEPDELRGAPPGSSGQSPGHARSKHGISNAKQADILNKPDRIFSGKNAAGREVDIYYKDGSVVITEAGKKDSVITAYGRASTKNGNNPVNPEKWAHDQNYVELEVDGQYRVTYPDRGSWEADQWPPP